MTLKGQSAIEFLSIIGLGLILITVGTYFGYDYILSYQDNINSINAKQTVNNLVSGANMIYSQGIGSKSKIPINIPQGIFVNKTYVSDGVLNLNYGVGADTVGYFPMEVGGLLPIGKGVNYIYLSMDDREMIRFKSNDSVAYVRIYMFNQSGYNNEDYTYAAGSTIYPMIYVRDFNNYQVSADITINLYAPSGKSIYYETAHIIPDNPFLGAIPLPSGSGNPEYGYYIFSILIPSQNSIATKIFLLTP